VHNDQIPYRPVAKAAVGAQRGLADALAKLVKTHNNFEVRPPLKLEAENGNWVLSADPSYGGGGVTIVGQPVVVSSGAEIHNGHPCVKQQRCLINITNGLITSWGSPEASWSRILGVVES